MTYDAVGNLQSMTDFNGETTTYRYNDRNWLIEKDFDDDPTVSMTYTRNGLVETMTDSRGVTQFEYDERDRLTKRIDPDGKWIAYGYDVAGNRTLVKTALGETRYTFDERNWLDTVIAASGTTDYDYNAVGNLVHTQFGNGTQENRRYDPLNRLVYLENQEADGDLISSYTYTLDKVGNRTSVMENDGRKVNYTYDELYRLTQEKVLDAVNGDRSSGYVYDNVGNRLTQTETVNGTTTTTGYIYDANDRLLRETVNGQITTTYTYDNNGNTLTKTEPGQETRYTWDDQNRLVAAEIVTADGIKYLEYEYDASGIRVASRVDGQETRYLIDANQPYAQVLEEYTPDGTVLTAYVYGNDLLSQTQYDPQTQTGNTTYYHVDGLGSTTALTDETGIVISTSRYDAYGQKIEGTGSIANKYLFAGEQFDENLGDYYLRARYYDSDTGRFNRRDDYEGRLSEPLTLHKYLYTHANPINGIDPTGYWAITEWILANKVLSALIATAVIGIGAAYYELSGQPLTRTWVRMGWLSEKSFSKSSGQTEQQVIDETARYVLGAISSQSKRDNVEYAGEIIKVPDTGKYHYTGPYKGTRDGSNENSRPSSGFAVADYHTHGDDRATPLDQFMSLFNGGIIPSYASELFSDDDRKSAKAKGITSYLLTPSGRILRMNPNSSNLRERDVGIQIN